MVVKIIVQKSSTKKRKKKCIYNSRPEQFEDEEYFTLQIYFFARKGNDEGNVSINSMSAYHHVYNT